MCIPQHHIPNHTGDWKGFYSTVEKIAHSPVPAPSSSSLKFEFTVDAAVHNSSLLEQAGYDLGKIIDQCPGSTISYGSELRPITQLEPLLHHHPTFQHFKSSHLNGIDYPIDEIDDAERKVILEATLERGNHKSSLSDEERPHVTKLMKQDVELGYGIPLSINCIRNIPGAEVYPVGCQNQLTIDETGKVIPKKRVTHDLSHNRRQGKSVNQRVREEEVPEVKFGHAMLRFLHLIHHIRRHHPNQRILCNKIDVEKAYRRLHVKAKVAVKCVAVWFLDKMWQGNYHKSNEQVAVLLTRLPFGSSPAPAEFCVVSETVFDLANDLLHCQLWNPQKLPSPYSDDLPPPERLDAQIPFGRADQADVSLDPSITGGADGYIDDGACAVLDSPENAHMVLRAAQAVVMALFLIFRPLAGLFEPIKRPDPASIRKMMAEGGLKETIIFLGWKINTRALSIALPTEKWIAWSAEIKALRKKKKASYQELASIIGKLNHVCFIIPDARHFMNNLRRAETTARIRKISKLNRRTLDDLALWLDFLQSAHQGISINRVIFRKPTITTFSDSSEFGIGGFCPQTGIAWRYHFTPDEQRAFTLNTKEYIGSAVDMEIQATHAPQTTHPCILNRSDSTSTVGWLRKSNHDPEDAPVHNEVARFHARSMMARGACNYSQHLPGRLNIIADSLSRDFHLSDEQLISMLTSLHPSLSPSQIKMVPPPPEIISWIASMAQRWPGKRVSPKVPTRSTIAVGIAGWDSNTASGSTTPIWKNSTVQEKYGSAVLSCMQCDEVILGEVDPKSTSKVPLRERPSTMWQRDLFQVVGAVPSSAPSARSTPTSNDKQEATNVRTPQQPTKRPYPPPYSGSY